jgi:hypothetical protein
MNIETTPWVLRAASVAVLSALLVTTGCGGGSKKPKPVDPPVVEPEPVLPPEVGDDIAQVISGAILDIKTGAVINGATVTFLQNGAAATGVNDIDGNAITSVTAAEGSFEVTVGSGVTQFTAVASAAGYIEKSAVVEVIADQDVVLAQIELTANAGVGVATTEKEATVDNAVAAADIVADTDDGVAQEDDTTVGSATVTVPATTQLQDAAGNPVTGTAVKVAVTFVEETDDQQANAAEATTVAASIPAGINEAEGSAADEVSVPLAVAQVNVTATDTATNTTTEVKRFNQPITITFNLPATTKVRSADRLVQAGDQFTVKSFDEDEGVWKVEPNKAFVGPAGPKGFPAELMVDHLTFFAVTDGVAACNQDINISYSGDTIPATGLIVRLFSSDLDITGLLRAGTTSETLTAAEAKAIGIAANATAAVRVRDADGNVWAETDGEVAFCGDVNLTLANPVQTVDENLTITAVCSNDTTVTTALTGALVKYRADATKPFRVAPGNGNGTYTMSGLVSGTEYSVVVDTNLAGVDGLQTTTITGDGTGESLDVSLACNTGTGSGGSGGSGG